MHWQNDLEPLLICKDRASVQMRYPSKCEDVHKRTTCFLHAKQRLHIQLGSESSIIPFGYQRGPLYRDFRIVDCWCSYLTFHRTGCNYLQTGVMHMIQGYPCQNISLLIPPMSGSHTGIYLRIYLRVSPTSLAQWIPVASIVCNPQFYPWVFNSGWFPWLPIYNTGQWIHWYSPLK